MTVDTIQIPTDSALKRAYGKIPTPVAVITAVHDETPIGMTVGSLASISLDPPLVSYYALDTSATAQRIIEAGRFQVNLLAKGQEDLCFQYASKRRVDERFAEDTWGWSPNHLPQLNGCVLWLDCELHERRTVGDHTMLVGRVLHVQEGASDATPLVFYRSQLGELDAKHIQMTQPHNFEWSLY
ncbi:MULTISPECIES: flavin reductase family protein [Micrococcaceae]|uniref:flavin reductase family protein n=1 Tax=Micrococcaceae TaxID=1268 RepID=UPI0004B6700B|nr:flavin reductase family protein [Arthrobacter sp. MA-N2]